MSAALTQADNGTRVRIQRGGALVIRLRENPTTGYRWAVDMPEESAPLIALDTTRYSVAANSGVGGAGERILEFKAVKPGTTVLRLKHWQPSEGEASVIDRFSVSVDIHD